MSSHLPPREAEWLEADGSGGFASGTVSGVRTRRYHGLLVPATMPPAGRTVLVNGIEAWVELSGATFAISSQRYNPDVLYFHSTHHENDSFQFAAIERSQQVVWRPYQDLPSIEARSNSNYRHDPCWYRNFLYVEEQRRGLDFIEDLASPGDFEWEMWTEPAVLLFSALPTNSDHAEGTLHFYSRGVTSFLHRNALPRTPISLGAVKDERSLPAIRGLAIGDATRSSRCGAFA